MPERRLDALLPILAVTAGATDAFSFLGLGHVFSSVMTANMVLLGLSAGEQNGPLALHTGAALTGVHCRGPGRKPGHRAIRPAGRPRTARDNGERTG